MSAGSRVGNGAVPIGSAVPPVIILQLSANASKANNDFTVHSWAAGDLLRDDLFVWSAINPSRVTVPVGYTRARITIQTSWAGNNAGLRWAYARLNASNSKVMLQDIRAASGSAVEWSIGATSAWLQGLIPGADYFDFTFAQTSGGALNLTGATGNVTATRVMIEWAP